MGRLMRGKAPFFDCRRRRRSSSDTNRAEDLVTPVIESYVTSILQFDSAQARDDSNSIHSLIADKHP